MKILFDHGLPFLLAHGGLQTQIEQTKAALEGIGAEVEYLRWWDENQRGDIIHYFGRPSGGYIDFAHAKGMKVVVAELHTGLGSRPPLARAVQKAMILAAGRVLPYSFRARMSWDAYAKADACVALTPWEAFLMRSMFGAPDFRTHVIPNGVETPFFGKAAPGDPPASGYLVCTATLAPRKKVLELAQAAAAAKIPVRILGKPYSEQDPYYRDFIRTRDAHPEFVLYDGPVHDREVLAGIYRSARGFVLLSTMESLSLSALEAAACGCPLLLSDLPWARSSFGDKASYVPDGAATAPIAEALRKFYDQAPSLPRPETPKTWPEIARQMEAIYRKILRH